MGVARFDSQSAALARIKFHDAAQIQHKICGARIAKRSAAVRLTRNRRKRPSITVYARPRFSENAKMVSADSTFNSQQTLKNLAAIVRPGAVGIPRKIQNVAVEIKHFIETPGCVCPGARFGARSV